MKKLFKLLTILSLIILFLAGCSNSDESIAQGVAKKFGTEFCTVDSKKIENYNALLKKFNSEIEKESENIQSNDKAIKSLMTSDGYLNLVRNKDNIKFTQLCIKGNYLMQITDLTLSKITYDAKENKAAYNFTAKLKITSSKDKTEQTDESQGRIGLIKENGQWKVNAYDITLFPKLLKKIL